MLYHQLSTDESMLNICVMIIESHSRGRIHQLEILNASHLTYLLWNSLFSTTIHYGHVVFCSKVIVFFTLSWIYPPLGTVTIYRERFIDFIKRFVFFARDYRTAKDVTSKHSSSQSLWDNHVRWFGTKCVCLPYIFVYTFGSVQISCLIVSFCTLLQWWPTKEHTYTIHHTPYTNQPSSFGYPRSPSLYRRRCLPWFQARMLQARTPRRMQARRFPRRRIFGENW